MRSDVVIVGYRLNAKEPAAKALERVLGLSASEARTLARAFPAVVAVGMPNDRAATIADALRAAGAQVELRPEAAVAAAGAQPSPSPQRSAPGKAADAVSGNYRLGDFDAPPAPKTTAGSVVAALPTRDDLDADDFGMSSSTAFELNTPPPKTSGSVVAPLPRGEDLDLEFGMSSSMALELNAPPPPKTTGGSVVAPLPRGEDLDLDLAMSSDMALELDAPSHAGRGHAPANDQGLHSERFDDLAPKAPMPQVEERAYRAVQQRAPATRRSSPPRRSAPPDRPAHELGRRLARSVTGWVPSLAFLLVLTCGSALAVGYALEPGDAVAALREHAERALERSERPNVSAEEEPRADLHLLLRAAPRSVHAPLATILRARIAGVHQTPVVFPDSRDHEVSCMLLEPSARDGAAMEALLETGHAVEAPANIAAQLREHARALRGQNPRLDELTPLCLGP